MKPKQLTFVWQDMNRHTVNTLQWSTSERTVEDAWNDAKSFLILRSSTCDPELLLAFKGLLLPLDESVPLRPLTKKEIKEFSTIA